MLRRFFAPPENFSCDYESVILSDDEARHLRDVLRLRAGDEVRVFDGAGDEFECIVEEFDKRAAEIKLSVRAPIEPTKPESPLRLTLAVALLKGEKFDLVVQKATELGAACIVPVITKRADVRIETKDVSSRVARWRRVGIEASKQCGRAVAPEIFAPKNFEEFLRETEKSLLRGAEAAAPSEGKEKNARGGNDETLRLLFSERGGASLDEICKTNAPSVASVFALVGSEGGWTDEELTHAHEAGWRLVTLGGRTLRAETAAIVAATLLQHRFGDLR